MCNRIASVDYVMIEMKRLSECRKFAQKEDEIRHDWVGKAIHRKLYKRFKFDHINKQ